MQAICKKKGYASHLQKKGYASHLKKKKCYASHLQMLMQLLPEMQVGAVATDAYLAVF